MAACSREFTLTVAGCPTPSPPAFTLPASENSIYAIPVGLVVNSDPAVIPGQLLGIPKQAFGGDGLYGISIINMATNPGTLVANHTWLPLFDQSNPSAMLYDPASGLIVTLMSRPAPGVGAIVFWDPVTGYVSHDDTAVVIGAVDDSARSAVTPIRGRSPLVLVNRNQDYWVVNTLTRSIVTTYNIGANAGKPTYCCDAEVGVVDHGVGTKMFDVDTGVLNGVALEAGTFSPVYVDSIQKIVAFKGTSIFGGTPYTMHVYDPVTGALEFNIAAQPSPFGFYGGDAERPAAYNFRLNRLVAMVANNTFDSTFLAYYNPSDWSFTLVKQGQDFDAWTPETLACGESDGVVNWHHNNGEYFMTAPIV